MFGKFLNKIQFHGIKTVYPVGERLVCFFNVPEYWQPENGDFIGIFPVGWSSVRDCLSKQVVRIEQFNGQPFGRVEFESIPVQPYGEQHYQFVYVNHCGEFQILGQSVPFKFITPETVYGGKYNQWCPTGLFGQQMYESEWQKLQSEIAGLEQNGWWFPQQSTVGYETIQKPFPGTWTGVYQPRIGKIEQILREKVKIEQAQRRLVQLCMLGQLRSCDRHILAVLKREPEIKEFLLRTKVATKIAAFEQKVYQVMKVKTTTFTVPAEHYIRRFETLLREKMALDIEKRRVLLNKLRQTIRECERKLVELQTVDQEQWIGFHQVLKTKITQLETVFGGIQQFETTGFPSMEFGKHFETVFGPFFFEQEKIGMNLYHSQRELALLINEVCTRLQEIELSTGSCYSTLRIPRIVSGLMYYTHPKWSQIVQLEKKIAEQKLKLKMRMLTGCSWFNQPGMPQIKFVEQLSRGAWFTPIIEKLKLVQFHLRRNWPYTQVSQKVWFEKKVNTVESLINTLSRFQHEVLGHVSPMNVPFFYPSIWTPSSSLFDQIKLRNILSQLRELRERECMEISRYYQQEIMPTHAIVEVCSNLGQVLVEKIGELNQYVQMPYFQQQQQSMIQFPLPLPFEFMVHDAQYAPAMLEIVEIERKLVEMKALSLAGIHYSHFDERLVELEQFVRQVGGQEYQIKRERCIEKIRTVKSFLNEHIEVNQPYGFVTIPEQFYQHQQKFDKLCQLFGELECHIVEQFPVPTGFYTIPQQQGSWYTPLNGCWWQQPQTFPLGGEIETPFLGGRINLGSVHQKFFRLIQDFQLQFPECFVPKVEEIVTFLREKQPIFCGNKPFHYYPTLGQELREKLIEFESILCQPECEIACLTTSLFPQSTLVINTTAKTQRDMLKYLIKQVRELKSHVHYFLNKEIGCNTFECEQQQLVELMNKKMWIDANNNRMMSCKPTIIENITTGIPTIVKSISVPTGLIRPVEKIMTGSEIVETEEIVNGTTTTTTTTTSTTNINTGCGNKFRELMNVINGGEWYENVIGDEYELENEWTDVIEQLPQTQMWTGVCPKPYGTTVLRVENNGNMVDECICQIEKQMRNYLTGNNKLVVEKNEVCPLCSLVGKETSVETNVLRRF